MNLRIKLSSLPKYFANWHSPAVDRAVPANYDQITHPSPKRGAL